MRILTARHADVTALVYGADSATLYGTGWGATGQDNDGLHVWHLGGDSDRAEFPYAGQRVWWCQPLPDGRLLLGVFGQNLFEYTVAITEDGGNLRRYPLRFRNAPVAVALSPAADRFICVKQMSDPVVECHRFDGSELRPDWQFQIRPHEGVAWKPVAFAPAGDRVLFQGRVWSQQLRLDGYVAFWRKAADGSSVGEPIPLTPSTSHVQLLADGSRLIAMAGAALLSYDLSNPTAKPKKATSGNRLHFNGIAVHPHSRRVLAICNDQSVREYDAVTMKPIRAYDWKIGKLRCLAVAPDGLTAAAVGARRKVVVWDLE